MLWRHRTRRDGNDRRGDDDYLGKAFAQSGIAVIGRCGIAAASDLGQELLNRVDERRGLAREVDLVADSQTHLGFHSSRSVGPTLAFSHSSFVGSGW
jgi:hypothetical protein